mmetsp:Transcript_2007/g.3643  ORF Transcript_2007/g.3643 Transcript_2007/m.3643 type:complete len:375 (-) Transcript_2007:3258-4382(-)
MQYIFKSMCKFNLKMMYRYLLVLCIGLASFNDFHFCLRQHVGNFHHQEDDFFALSSVVSSMAHIHHEIANQKSRNNTTTHSSCCRSLEERFNPSSTIISRDDDMRLLKMMQEGRVMNKGYFTFILEESKKLSHSLKNVYNLSHPAKRHGSLPNSTVTIVGDIHGQYPVMLHIFLSNDFPSLSHVYIFNGDFTDKGKYSLQTFTALMILKLHCCECIHFTRGNHEARQYFKRKLYKQIMKHYGDEAIFKLALKVANEIPLGIILEDKTLVIHAGITGPNLTIADLNRIPKGIDATEDALLDEFLWADPQDENGILDVSKRGRMTKAFLDLNNLDRIIRGHDNVKDGYIVHHQGRVVTIWSAPISLAGRGAMRMSA